MSLYKNDKLDYLHHSIESVLNQTFKDFKFYIQLDGKIPTETLNYLSSIDDKRLIINKRDVNKGLAASLNELLKIVLPLNYIYIARMDADDICKIDRFAKQTLFLDMNNNHHLVGSNAIIIDENSKDIGKKKVKHQFNFSDMLKKCELIHPSVMFRNEFFDKVGFYDESLTKSQDYDLWLRALNLGVKMCNLNEALIKFRYDPNLIERRKKEQKFNIIIKKKFLQGVKLWIALIPNILIIILPTFILKFILNSKN
ncbi:glycosyltransferase [Flavobacteriaceae bacterium]|nr:glycosyltransferase [Flavobacteriaceae bacterium]